MIKVIAFILFSNGTVLQAESYGRGYIEGHNPISPMTCQRTARRLVGVAIKANNITIPVVGVWFNCQEET